MAVSASALVRLAHAEEGDPARFQRLVEQFYGAEAGPAVVADLTQLGHAAIVRLAEVEGRGFDAVLADVAATLER